MGVIPTVDDLLGVDPILDAEESIKPKEVKEKSSKQKTLKQGKKVKPSIVEAALISAGETALEPTPAAEEDDIIFSDDLQGGVDPILEAEEISKPKERKEKSSKLKAPKQVKKVKPSDFEAALIDAGEIALEPTPAADEDDVIFSDDLVGNDPLLDTEESGDPWEIKEKSSKQKTLKQGKKVKPSIVEAALISAGETALEPTPAAE